MYRPFIKHNHNNAILSTGVLYVVNDGPVTVGEVITVAVLLQTEVPLFQLDLQFGSNVISKYQVNTSIMADRQSVAQWLTLTHHDLYQEAAWDGSWSITLFGNIYNTSGIYPVFVNVSDPNSNTTASDKSILLTAESDIFVRQKACKLPTVTVTGGGVTRTTAMTFSHKQRIFLSPELRSDCPITANVHFNWTVYLMVDTELIMDGTPVILPPSMLTMKQLIIDEYSLDTGVYLIHLKVSTFLGWLRVTNPTIRLTIYVCLILVI